ncbi:MAG TPA: hypothetical protein VH253_10760 [Phycisphaerae bacterium]|nr:hypothetical protein [Phycisphaerae bacterium]
MLNPPADPPAVCRRHPMALMMTTFVTPKKLKIAMLVLLTFAAMC